MFLKIKTEYDEILLYSEKDIDLGLIESEVKLMKMDFEEWESKKKKYFEENNLNDKEINIDIHNLSKNFTKYGSDNKFLLKRFEDLKIVQKKMSEYYNLNPHPKYEVEKRLHKLGLNEVKLIKCDAEIKIGMEVNSIKLTS